MAKKEKLMVIPLGGLGEIGKNMTVIQYGNDIIVIDAGLSFPDDDMFGIDLVIPDMSYLIENRDKVRAVVITHGHEDHIGSLAYLLNEVNVPVYATKLVCGLSEGKLKENHITNYKLNEVQHGDEVQIGCMKVGFIRTNHSIPYARAQGLGQYFVQYAPRHALVKAFLWALMPLVVAGWSYCLLLGAAMLISLGLNTYIARRLGGVTGDTYGAVIELSEMLLLGLAFLASGAVQTACIWI